MANRLAMDKVQAIQTLASNGRSERQIARALGISRKAVRRHLGRESPKGTKAPTGEAPTGSAAPKDTKAPTGSEGSQNASEPPPDGPSAEGSRSLCCPFQATILAQLEQGLTAQRIYQDLCEDHGFSGKYSSVRRFVRLLSERTELAFRRLLKRSGETLFEIVLRRHEVKSTMMTSNRPLDDWGKLVGDVPSATAILDRFLHHSEIIQITGRSYRLATREKAPKETKAPTGSEADEKTAK